MPGFTEYLCTILNHELNWNIKKKHEINVILAWGGKYSLDQQKHFYEIMSIQIIVASLNVNFLQHTLKTMIFVILSNVHAWFS